MEPIPVIPTPPDDPAWERQVAEMGRPVEVDGRVTAAGALALLGGSATRQQLRGHLTQRELLAAVHDGSIARVGHGRFALPAVRDYKRLAVQHRAVVSHLTAALAHGWPVLVAPTVASLTVRRGRTLRRFDGSIIRPYAAPLTDAELAAGVTPPLRTVVDCARTLPWGEALAVADSALRSGRVRPAELTAAAERARGPGSAQARRVAAHATAAAYGPFESVVRSIALDVPGLTPVAQLEVAHPGLLAHVDVGDPHLRIAIEAESLEYHWTRDELEADCSRYTVLAAYGWVVLRVTWVAAMFRPEWVRWALEVAVATRLGDPPSPPPQPAAAGCSAATSASQSPRSSPAISVG